MLSRAGIIIRSQCEDVAFGTDSNMRKPEQKANLYSLDPPSVNPHKKDVFHCDFGIFHASVSSNRVKTQQEK